MPQIHWKSKINQHINISSRYYANEYQKTNDSCPLKGMEAWRMHNQQHLIRPHLGLTQANYRRSGIVHSSLFLFSQNTRKQSDLRPGNILFHQFLLIHFVALMSPARTVVASLLSSLYGNLSCRHSVIEIKLENLVICSANALLCVMETNQWLEGAPSW